MRLCLRVLKASGLFSIAKSPRHPALCNPSERPPQPANKSIQMGRSTLLIEGIIIYFDNIQKYISMGMYPILIFELFYFK
jgi:hypothetical protein